MVDIPGVYVCVDCKRRGTSFVADFRGVGSHVRVEARGECVWFLSDGLNGVCICIVPALVPWREPVADHKSLSGSIPTEQLYKDLAAKRRCFEI